MTRAVSPFATSEGLHLPGLWVASLPLQLPGPASRDDSKAEGVCGGSDLAREWRPWEEAHGGSRRDVLGGKVDPGSFPAASLPPLPSERDLPLSWPGVAGEGLTRNLLGLRERTLELREEEEGAQRLGEAVWGAGWGRCRQGARVIIHSHQRVLQFPRTSSHDISTFLFPLLV